MDKNKVVVSEKEKTTEQGLCVKYNVFKVKDGSEVNNCFVLRPDKDKAAVEALRRYAEVTENKQLAGDIYNWVGNKDLTTAEKLYKISDNFVIEICGDKVGYINLISLCFKSAKERKEERFNFGEAYIYETKAEAINAAYEFAMGEKK